MCYLVSDLRVGEKNAFSEHSTNNIYCAITLTDLYKLISVKANKDYNTGQHTNYIHGERDQIHYIHHYY